MTSPIRLVQRMVAHDLETLVSFINEGAQSHYNGRSKAFPPSATVLPSESIDITMTPYTTDEEAELYYMFELASFSEEEDPIDLGRGSRVEQFSVHGRSNAQKIFGFLASQFFYEEMGEESHA